MFGGKPSRVALGASEMADRESCEVELRLKSSPVCGSSAESGEYMITSADNADSPLLMRVCRG